MSARHAPVPWTALRNSSYWQFNDASRRQVGDVCASDPKTPDSGVQEANATFIVRACNAHEDMLAALEALLDHYVELVVSGDCGNWDPEKEAQVIAARAAIAKARGQS